MPIAKLVRCSSERKQLVHPMRYMFLPPLPTVIHITHLHHNWTHYT